MSRNILFFVGNVKDLLLSPGELEKLAQEFEQKKQEALQQARRKASL